MIETEKLRAFMKRFYVLPDWDADFAAVRDMKSSSCGIDNDFNIRGRIDSQGYSNWLSGCSDLYLSLQIERQIDNASYILKSHFFVRDFSPELIFHSLFKNLSISPSALSSEIMLLIRGIRFWASDFLEKARCNVLLYRAFSAAMILFCHPFSLIIE